MNYLFDSERFMPHGHCYLWDPGILWTSVISDALIFAAYTAIPFTLVFLIMRKRHDLPFNWMFVCFGLFIVACGLTHLMEVVTVWKPFYPISAIVKAITAAASVPTAIILYQIAPKIVRLPSVAQLVHEQSLRLKAEAASEAKDRFIAVLSHELRTPLTPVRAGLDLIEQEFKRTNGGEESATVRDALTMVRRNLEMETMLINDLLDVSVAQHGQLDLDRDLVDMDEVVRESVAVFRDQAAKKSLNFELKVETDKTVVIGAALRLHQVINNLLSNAIKYTPDNGRIAVRLTSHQDVLQLRVEDSGRGIDPESLERIFEPFEQGDHQAKSRAGLGLGLTISRTIVQAHHGRLTAESAGTDKGAAFIVELPLAQQQRRTIPPIHDAATRKHDGAAKPSLLLVEDHADTLSTLAALLRRDGYEVLTAGSVAEADPLLARAEVLVSDIGLPDGSGCELMRRFKERGGRHGIAITGFGQPEDVARSENAGFSRHITKPVEIAVLKTALAELIAGVPA